MGKIKKTAGPQEYSNRKSVVSMNYEYQLILDSDVSLKSNVIEHLFDNFKGYATGKLIMVDS